MKNAILFHGHGGTPDSFWLPWLKGELEKAGYEVYVPQLPSTDNPNIEEQLSFALSHGKFNEETLLIGHSSGCALILGILDSIPTRIKRVICVAGFASKLRDDEVSTRQIRPFRWDNIRAHAEHFVFINSDNDPWGADDKKGREMFDELGGVQIILHGEGHMGSDSFNQPYKEFPLLLKFID